MKALKFPPAFQDVLFAHLKKFYIKGTSSDSEWNEKDVKYFAKGIIKLNESFTITKTDRAMNYFNDPVMRSGYLAYFLPVNAMKAYSLLTKINPSIPRPKIQILDLGAGPLTFSLGYLFFLANKLTKRKGNTEIIIHAVEQNEKILKDGTTLLHNFVKASGLDKKVKVKVIPYVGNAFQTRLKTNSVDLILSGNFLNEIPERRKQAEYFLKLLRKHSHPHTQVFLLEPASKKISRDLQSLRDQIIGETDYTVLAPCLHQQTCPLNLTAKSDWCNFTQTWESPDFIQDFDTITKLKKTFLMYSYLFLQNNAAELAKHTAKEFIAISNGMREKGRYELIGCGPAGRIRFIRSNQNGSEGNNAIESMTRGQNFSISPFESEEFELNRNVNLGKNHKIISADL